MLIADPAFVFVRQEPPIACVRLEILVRESILIEDVLWVLGFPCQHESVESRIHLPSDSAADLRLVHKSLLVDNFPLFGANQILLVLLELGWPLLAVHFLGVERGIVLEQTFLDHVNLGDSLVSFEVDAHVRVHSRFVDSKLVENLAGELPILVKAEVIQMDARKGVELREGARDSYQRFGVKIHA
jgi:hypothetical protein